MVGAIPTVEPPDITNERRFGFSDFNASQNTNRNRRTLPHWIDVEDRHGDAEFLRLQGINNSPLPKKPFIIGKTVEITAEGPIAGAFSEARGTKYTLEVRDKKQVEKLLKLTKLIDGTEVEVIYHPTRNTCRCVITCWDFADVDIAEIQENLSNQRITNVRRITRKTENGTINTGTLILTVRGTTPPSHVKLGLLRVPTRQYYPAPMLCFKCLSYGHTKFQCTAEDKCINCAGKHDTTGECTRSPRCNNCPQNHASTSRTCPVYRKEAEIIRIKIDEGLNYENAKKSYQSRVTASKGSYAQSVQDSTMQNKEFAELSEKLKQQHEKNKSLSAENDKLREELSNLQQTLNKVLKNQDKLQQQLKDLLSPATTIAQKISTPQSEETPRMKTRQHAKTNKQCGSKNISNICNNTTIQNDRNKRPVSSAPKKPMKLAKNNSLDIPELSNSSSEETQSEQEVTEYMHQD